MKFKLLIIFSFFLIIVSNAQKQEIINQLESELVNAKNTNDLLRIHCDLADLYIKVQLAKSFENLSAIDNIIKNYTPDQNFLLRFYEVYANAYYYKLSYKNALNYFNKAIEVSKQLNYNEKTDTLLYNAATVAYKSGKLNDAIDKYNSLLKSAKKNKDKDMQMQLLQTLYIVSMDKKDYKSAVEYLDKYLSLVNEGFHENINRVNLLEKKVKVFNLQLNETNQVLTVTKKELKSTSTELKTTSIVLDSVSAENLRLIADTLQKRLTIAEMEIQKQHDEANIKAKENKIKLQDIEAQKKQQAIILLLGIIASVFLGVIFILFLYRRIKKQNKLLANKNKIIEEKNQQIVESLNYAQTIQIAIMPNQSNLNTYLNESYIFFRPRDIVSGDFYWFFKKNDNILVSAVDCTGHGVPGAMLSMIGNALLNKIVIEKDITSPSNILNELHLETLKILSKNRGSISQDGMDMVLCSINKENKKIIFSGAKNSLYYIQNSELKKLNGTYASVGYAPIRRDREVKFNEEIIEYKDEISLFLTTDGYADQFGIVKDVQEKFNLDNLEKLLIKFDIMDAKSHKKLLETEMSNWQKSLPQTDDMLIIGIKIS